MSANRKDQAVIFIHGIGEQKPMDTIRSFVEAVLPEPESGAKYWSKPDQMSESFELRKLQNRQYPRTHFFEYYWAYKVEGTKIGHVINWIKVLLIRAPRNVPEHVRFLWWLSWSLIVSIVVGIIVGIALGLFSDLSGSVQTIPWAVSALLTATLGFLENSIKDSLGDAARYLSPTPKNIALRREIRTDGINLLRKIQSDDKYDRVIMVGHSLGSVIAYDILKYVWYECNRTYDPPAKHRAKYKQAALRRIEKAGEALRTEPKNDSKLNEFRDAQIELWRELRDLGNPWKVSDFITMGNPLAHGFLLLAKDYHEFKERKGERELPTCPPIADEVEITGRQTRCGYSFKDTWHPHEIKDGKKDEMVVLKSLHSAAPFACTRWTNLYFPAVLGLFGDMVGGPVRKWFGPGVKDIQVRWTGLSQFTLIAHSSYWRGNKKIKEGEASLPALIEALDLNGKNTFK